jgi:fructokinase
VTVSRVLAIGELLWDLLPGGQRLGGAPFNVVAHLRQMGHEVALLTGVGDDERGRAALAEASELGVGTQFMRVVPGVPTGIVHVELDPTGIPRFDIVSPAAYEYVADDRGSVVEAARYAPDAVVFGTLAQRSPSVRHATTVVIEANPGSLRIYDVNLREGCWHPELVDELLSSATVVKLNDDEVRALDRCSTCPPIRTRASRVH